MEVVETLQTGKGSDRRTDVMQSVVKEQEQSRMKFKKLLLLPVQLSTPLLT